MTVLEFVTGGTPDNPPRTPTETLDLAGYNIGERIYLHTDGFSPSVKAKRTTTKTIGRNGQRLIEAESDNVTIDLYTYLSGTGYTQLEYARREIAKYVQQAEDYEINGIGSPVWIRHRWTPPTLKDKEDPQAGQWSRYWRVLGADMEWPRDLHAGQLVSGNVERLLTRLVCAPTALGHRELAYNIAGVPGTSDVAFSKAVSLSTTTTDWCIAGWFKHFAGDYCAFELYYTSSYYFNVRYNNSSTRWEIRYKAGGSEVQVNSPSSSYTAETWLHIAMTNNGSVYVNGSLRTTMGAYGWSTGTLYLADRLSGSDTGYADRVDAWRVWEENWTATEVQALYADELPIKSDGLTIGRPVYNKTRSGAGSLDNCDGTISSNAKDNWSVIGNVPGDLPTPLRVIINPPTAGPTSSGWGYYLGLETSATALTPTNQHWVEYSGTTDTGSSSNDSYKQDTSISGSSDWILYYDISTQAYAELLRGRYTILMRFRSVTLDVTIQPFIQFYDSNSRVLFAEKVVADGSTMNLVEVGDFVLPDYESLPRIVWGAYINAPGSTYTVYTDFLTILKNAVRLTLTTSASITSSTTDKLIIEHGRAELQKSTGQKYRDISYVGPVLEVSPGQYNYLFALFGADGDQHYPQLASGGVTIYVTPRWVTSGGPVAG